MSKRIRIWDENKYKRYMRKGRGQGEGSIYLPWVQVQDFASRGTVSRIAGSKTGRTHHFMSSNEKNYFYLLEWSDDVLDIREQFPLSDIELASDLAAMAGIRYPKDNVSGFPYVLTCDFMITTRQGFKARTIKPSCELNDKRTLEKLEIERRYWKCLGVDWRLVTEREIPISKVQNLEWLHPAALPPELPCYQYQTEELMRQIEILYMYGKHSLYDIGLWLDKEYGLPDGSGLYLVRHLMWTKRLPCSIDSEILVSAPIAQAS